VDPDIVTSTRITATCPLPRENGGYLVRITEPSANGKCNGSKSLKAHLARASLARLRSMKLLFYERHEPYFWLLSCFHSRIYSTFYLANLLFAWKSRRITRAFRHGAGENVLLELIFPLTCLVLSRFIRLRRVRKTCILVLHRHVYASWNLSRPRRGVMTTNRGTRFTSYELNTLLDVAKLDVIACKRRTLEFSFIVHVENVETLPMYATIKKLILVFPDPITWFANDTKIS